MEAGRASVRKEEGEGPRQGLAPPATGSQRGLREPQSSLPSSEDPQEGGKGPGLQARGPPC